MRFSDILLIGLATVGIYYIGRRFLKDSNKPTMNTIIGNQTTPQNDVIAQAPPKVVTMVGTPTIDGDFDVLRWVENE